MNKQKIIKLQITDHETNAGNIVKIDEKPSRNRKRVLIFRESKSVIHFNRDAKTSISPLPHVTDPKSLMLDIYHVAITPEQEEDLMNNGGWKSPTGKELSHIIFRLPEDPSIKNTDIVSTIKKYPYFYTHVENIDISKLYHMVSEKTYSFLPKGATISISNGDVLLFQNKETSFILFVMENGFKKTSDKSLIKLFNEMK